MRAVRAREAHVGREVVERVVAPVVRQAARDEMPIVGVEVDRQQLDRRDAEVREVLDAPRPTPGPGTCRAAAPGRAGARRVKPFTCSS